MKEPVAGNTCDAAHKSLVWITLAPSCSVFSRVKH
jgi:hypothetical protein